MEIPRHIVEQMQYRECEDCPPRRGKTACYPMDSDRTGHPRWRCDICIVYAIRSTTTT